MVHETDMRLRWHFFFNSLTRHCSSFNDYTQFINLIIVCYKSNSTPNMQCVYANHLKCAAHLRLFCILNGRGNRLTKSWVFGRKKKVNIFQAHRHRHENIFHKISNLFLKLSFAPAATRIRETFNISILVQCSFRYSSTSFLFSDSFDVFPLKINKKKKFLLNNLTCSVLMNLWCERT